MKIKNYAILNVMKNKTFLHSLIILASLVLPGCWNQSSSSEKLIIINVLDKENYDDCHITGSIHIPFENLEEDIKHLSKKNHYVFYCSNYACSAAPFSAKTMKDQGFDHVYVYPGGIVDWYQKQYPYQGPAKLSYLKDKNEPLEEDLEGVGILEAKDLKSKMEKFGILK